MMILLRILWVIDGDGIGVGFLELFAIYDLGIDRLYGLYFYVVDL